MTGRSIRIYLVDGDASGLLTAEVMNWSGKFVVAPRTMLKELALRDEVSRTGVPPEDVFARGLKMLFCESD